jgi:enterochelin esterase-like enzyme
MQRTLTTTAYTTHHRQQDAQRRPRDLSRHTLGAPATTSPLWQNPDLRTRLGIQLGGGEFDSLTIPGVTNYAASFAANGIPFSTDLVIGGHEWYTWRQLLYNFLTTVAFMHPAGTP